MILSGCVAALEDSPSLVVPRVISGGLKGSVFVHEVVCGYIGVLDGSVLWVVLGVSSNSPHGTVGLTSKFGRSKSVPNSASASTIVTVLVIPIDCIAALEVSAFWVLPRVISGVLKGFVFVHVVGSGNVDVLDASILWVVLDVFSKSPQGTVGLTSKSKRPKSAPTVGIESYSSKSNGSCLRFLMFFLNVC